MSPRATHLAVMKRRMAAAQEVEARAQAVHRLLREGAGPFHDGQGLGRQRLIEQPQRTIVGPASVAREYGRGRMTRDRRRGTNARVAKGQAFRHAYHSYTAARQRSLAVVRQCAYRAAKTLTLAESFRAKASS